MAHPFGGHPTLEQFVQEAEQHGCSAAMEVRQARSGRAYNALVITNEHGASLTIVDPDLTERLSPSLVTNYQRRLSIKTKFAGLPEQPSPDSEEPHDPTRDA